LEKSWLRNWPRYVPQNIEYPEISLGEALERSAQEAADNVAVHYHDVSLTFKNLDGLVNGFADSLRILGVKRNDRVALYLPNVPQFVLAYYAILKIGAIVVTVSPLYKERELGIILADSKAKVIITLNRLYPYVQLVQQKTKLEHVIITEGNTLAPNDLSPHYDIESNSYAGTLAMEPLLSPHREPFESAKIKPKTDLALLQYTGGTTGTPKGVMLTHYNLVVNAAQFATWLQMQPGQEVHLSALPFFHIYGMTTSLNVPIYTWSPMILIPDARDTNAILRAIDKYEPTIFCGVPSMYISLINHPDIRIHNLHSIRVCVSGATGLPVEVQRKFEELTGGRLVEGYGLTEASPVTHVNPLDDRRKNRTGSIGIPVSDTDAKIVDLERGKHDLPPQTMGELVVRGPQVMVGYWNNPTESKVVLSEGWLHTGDIAIMDPDGYFRIVDRKKDMINISGLKVWPREVEEILYENPAVREAAVVGVPDPVSGEAVKAFVVLKEEYRGRIGAEEISAFCRIRIASYKAPRIVEFLESLPKTSVGKILRRELRKPIEQSPHN
jgi:long-chain acyl-CoA synthetase